MTLKLYSENPNFSYIIRKNITNGMQIRKISDDMYYGWYTNEKTYCVYPICEESLLKIFFEFFRDTIKTFEDYDNGYDTVMTIEMLHIRSKNMFYRMMKFYDGIEYELLWICNKYYTLTIKTNISLHYLLNICALIFLFTSLDVNMISDINSDMITKYLGIIVGLDAPFYIRHMFANNILWKKKLFKQFRGELEKTNRYDLKMAYGNTHTQRMEYIESLLDFSRPILDIGCGEGFYVTRFCKKVDKYYAIDIDEKMLEIVSNKIKKNDIENVIINDDYKIVGNEKVDIIISEVIEHMSIHEAERLIKNVMKNVNYHKIVITTPNKDFNQYYLMDDDKYRHDDHKWEMGREKFRKWLSGFVENFVEIGIGCYINGCPSTQGIVIAKKNE